jgi:ABC-type phosphate transport system permease subunit
LGSTSTSAGLPVRHRQRVGGRWRHDLTAGIVLAVMILPIITAVTRGVRQTPKGQIEAALALGATRWEVVRTTVLPFGMSGYISGAMLGLVARWVRPSPC